MKGSSKISIWLGKTSKKLTKIVGRPSTKDFIKIIEGGSIQKNPINRDHSYKAEYIFGADVGILSGKTTRQKVDNVNNSSD